MALPARVHCLNLCFETHYHAERFVVRLLVGVEHRRAGGGSGRENTAHGPLFVFWVVVVLMDDGVALQAHHFVAFAVSNASGVSPMSA